MQEELKPLAKVKSVKDARVLGVIGVVEMKEPVQMEKIQEQFVAQGVWLRPFGRLIYTMSPPPHHHSTPTLKNYHYN